MKFISSLISVGVAALLVGCGGSSNSSSNTTQSTLKKSLVCQDQNLNSTCEDSEVIEKVSSWEDYNNTTVQSRAVSNNFPLLYDGDDGLKLLAANDSKTITPLTTLIYNEIINNESVNTEQEALTYLENKFNFKTKLDDNLSKEIISGLKDLKKKGFSYKNLNTFVSKAVTQKNFKVNVENLDTNTSTNLNKTWNVQKRATSLTWEQSDHDETAVASTIRGNTAVIASKYHNSLIVVDTKDDNVTHNKFSSIAGERFALDTVTGASEHTMADIELAPNEKDLYVLVKTANSDLKSADKTWGLFKTQIENKKINDFNHESTIRVENKNISDIALSNDGNTLVAYDSNLAIIKFFNKDLSDTSKEIDLDGKTYYDMLISADNKHLIVSVKEKDVYKLLKYSVENQSLVSSLNIEYNASLRINKKNNELVIFKKEDGKSLFIVNIENLQIKKEIGVDLVVKTIDISNNKLLISGDTKKEVLVYDLEHKNPKVEFTVEPKELVQTLFATENKLYLPLYEKGETEVVDFNVSGLGKHKLDSDLSKLTYETINHGMPFEAVLFDLQLNKSALRGSGNNISWTASDTIKNNITLTGIDIGKIKRPANTENDLSGTLTATITKDFRGEQIVKSKDFNLTIRKEPIYLNHSDKYTLGSLDGAGYVFYLDTDGSKVITQVFGRNTGGNGFKVFEVNTTTNKLDKRVEGIAIDSNGVENNDTSKNTMVQGQLYDGIYASSEGAGAFIKDEKAIFVLKTPTKIEADKSKTILANGALMVYDISDNAISSNANKAKKVGDAVVFDGNNTTALFSERKGDNLAVLIEGSFDGNKTKKAYIYDISNIDAPKLKTKVDNVEGKKISLSDDGSNLYTLDGTTIKKYSVDSNSKLSSEVENAQAFTIKESNGNILIGDKEGNLNIYNSNLVLQNKYITGYGRYGGRTSGEGHAFGRVEDIQVMNNKIYMGNKYRGLIILDANDISNIKELKVYKHENYRRGIVNPAGTKAIPFYYHSRDQNDIGYINLQ